MHIGFIGLGKLGKPCAEVIATQHKVTGYDINIVHFIGIVDVIYKIMRIGRNNVLWVLHGKGTNRVSFFFKQFL